MGCLAGWPGPPPPAWLAPCCTCSLPRSSLPHLPPAWALPHPTQPCLQIWGRLTRQLIPEVSQNTELFTMLPVPNPFVVPGARFREASSTAMAVRMQLRSWPWAAARGGCCGRVAGVKRGIEGGACWGHRRRCLLSSLDLHARQHVGPPNPCLADLLLGQVCPCS